MLFFDHIGAQNLFFLWKYLLLFDDIGAQNFILHENSI
jgi:hypothetical protein